MRRSSFLALLGLTVLPAAVVLTPASSTASIYSWRDANGVVTYSNTPPAVTTNAPVAVLVTETAPPEPPGVATAGPMLADAVQPQPPDPSPYVATQGDFVVQLVRELGLGEPADAGEAADVLTNLRIVPPLGIWRFDQPMTPELTIRLRQLSVAAADRGEIDITPEQALLAFDTAAALLHVDIPAPTDQASISDDPYPIADMPPLIDFYQPAPVFYPYYIWTPVYGGFWWGYSYFPGYWVLNVTLFCNHYYDHYYGYNYDGHYSDGHHRDYAHGYRGWDARFASIDPAHISHRLNGHINEHRLHARPPAAGRTVSSPGQPRSPFHRTIPQTIPHTIPTMRAGVAGLRATRPVGTDRVSYARSPLTHRAAPRPLSSHSPSFHARSPHARTYISPFYRSPSFRGPYTSSRSMGRAAFTPPSKSHYGSPGAAPSRPSFHGGMGMTRTFERSSGDVRSGSVGRGRSSGRGPASTGFSAR
jgi:hypothetical protein